MNVDGISRIGRATQGVRMIQTAEEDVVASAIRTAQDAEAPEAAEGLAAEAADPYLETPPEAIDAEDDSDTPEQEE